MTARLRPRDRHRRTYWVSLRFNPRPARATRPSAARRTAPSLVDPSGTIARQQLPQRGRAARRQDRADRLDRRRRRARRRARDPHAERPARHQLRHRRAHVLTLDGNRDQFWGGAVSGGKLRHRLARRRHDADRGANRETAACSSSFRAITGAFRLKPTSKGSQCRDLIDSGRSACKPLPVLAACGRSENRVGR